MGRYAPGLLCALVVTTFSLMPAGLFGAADAQNVRDWGGETGTPDADRGTTAEVAVASGKASAYRLSQAFRDALARDPRIEAAQGRVAEARERLEEVRSRYRPSIWAEGATGYDYIENESRTVSSYEGRSIRGSLKVAQSVPVFGRRQGLLRRARAEISEAESVAETIRQDVLAETAHHFAGQVYQSLNAERWRSFEMLVEELELAARERIAIGALDRTELYEIRSRLHQARVSRLQSESRYRIESARLARLTGESRTNLAAASLRLREVVPSNLGEALNLIDTGSPTLAKARWRLEAAEGELTFHEADLRPALTLEAGVSSGRVGDIETLDVGAGVKLAAPLYEGGSRHSRLRRARLAAKRARQELIAEKERIEIEVRSGWDELESRILVQQDLEAAVADALTAVALTRDKVNEGRTTLVRHIEARKSALEAEFTKFDNQLRLEAVRIELLRVLGEL